MANRIIFILLIIVSLSSCENRILYEDIVTFDKNGWDKDSPAKFSFFYKDTSLVVDIGMTFKHADDYSFSNLWLFLDISGPTGIIQKDTIELFFYRNDGKMLGKQRDGNIEISSLYKHGVKLSQPGEYSFSIGQGMRHNQLKSIESVSLWMQTSNYQAD